jgi:hypothetical protein
VSHLDRFNVRLTEARSPDEEKESLWVSRADVIRMFSMMREGDTAVVDHVGSAEEGVMYG